MTRGARICFFNTCVTTAWPLACRVGVGPDIEHDPGLVHGAPQPVLHTGDLDHDLVQVPFVADTREPAADPVGELLAKFAGPLPHRFVANDDATGRQQLLNHTQPEREPEIQPDGVADDLAGEPITGIAGAGRCHHPTRLPTPVRFRKRGAVKLTVPAASLYKSSDDIRLCPAARAPVSRKC